MTRIWLRLELFEHGLLQFPSKYAATLTVANVKRSLDALHARFHGEQGQEPPSSDVNMEVDSDAPVSAETLAPIVVPSSGGYVEDDNLVNVSFPFWRETVAPIFQWRDQDYEAFWLLLVQFHRKIPVHESYVIPSSIIMDEEQCLSQLQVPMFKLVTFLFIQTVKPHSWRNKYAIETFNSVWYREDAPLSHSGQPSPIVSSSGNMSPQFKGNSSPPAPHSPHTVGMQDRSTSDAYYLEFIREKLGDLFSLLYPSTSTEEGSETTITSDQVNWLGFLLCGGTRTMLDFSQSLSAAYPNWQQSGGATPFAGTGSNQEETAAKLCRFFKTHLYLNETLYPPVGFTLSSHAHVSSGYFSPIVGGTTPRDFKLADAGADAATEDEHNVMQRPTVLSNLSKTTVIKRAEDFVDKAGNSDLVIFSCHDAYIYIVGPVRHVMITACNNCKILTAPNSGIFCIDRCENVQVTAIAGLIRVSNCLDSVINSYTTVPLIMTGENVGVRLGPYNSKYPGLLHQLAIAQITFRPDSQGCWGNFINLEDESDLTEGEKKPISLQSPSTFREIVVPVKIQGQGPAERPFPLPQSYADALRSQQETVESLRKLVGSDEFDLSTKRTMEMVIQMRFKEWLSASGNVRQILDLVQIERVRGQSNSASPVKDRV